MKYLLTFSMLVFCVVSYPNPRRSGNDDPRRNLFRGRTIDVTSRGLSVSDDDMLWPHKTIYYTFNPNLSSRTIRVIGNAMRIWESVSCVKFRRRTYEKYYVEFYKGVGCHSMVGFQRESPQWSSIGDGCVHKGKVLHEIAHVMGIFHEQNRPDRDRYIDIIYKNIQKGHYRKNFKKIRFSDTHGTPYDYNSLMQYGSRYFSKDGHSRTIIPKKAGVKIGNRRGPSKGDIQIVNLTYRC